MRLGDVWVGTSYKAITEVTACTAADAAAAHLSGCPFVFVSAAEAAWPADLPLLPPFLKNYLEAKRNVEKHLAQLTAAGVTLVRGLHATSNLHA